MRTSPIRRSDSGFTLLEVLIALAIIASIAGASTLIFSKRISSLQAEREVRTIVDSLQKARLAAMTSGTETRVEFDLDQRQLVYLPKQLVTAMHSNMSVEITVDRGLAARRRAAVRFFPDGSSTGADIQVNFRDYEFEIGVDWLTGLTQIERRVVDGTE